VEIQRPNVPTKSSDKTLSIRPMSRVRLELDGIVELGKTESTQNLIRNFFLAEKSRRELMRTPPKKSCTLPVIGAV